MGGIPCGRYVWSDGTNECCTACSCTVSESTTTTADGVSADGSRRDVRNVAGAANRYDGELGDLTGDRALGLGLDDTGPGLPPEGLRLGLGGRGEVAGCAGCGAYPTTPDHPLQEELPAPALLTRAAAPAPKC